MVGREYEAGGIAKHGAKMVTAVACARVPKLTVVIGGSFGAGQLRDVRPGVLAAVPVDVAERPDLGDGRRAGRRGAGDGPPRPARRRLAAEEEEAFKRPIREQYEHQGSPYYSTARLWDDGVIDPADTRTGARPGPVGRGQRPARARRLRRLPDVSACSTTVLVANRGEIAVRVIRTLRRLGIRSVAVYTDADAGARHVREADVAVRRGAGSRATCTSTPWSARPGAAGAEAVHPGYGFLSENPAFARPARSTASSSSGRRRGAIEAMGDKIAAKRTVAAAGVPVVPGSDDAGLTDARAGRGGTGRRAGGGLPGAAQAVGRAAAARACGWSATPAELADAIAAARREAVGAFGDDTLLVERFVDQPAAHRDPGPRRRARPRRCTSASASAACSGGTRRSSRRRRRRCSPTAASGAGPGRDGRQRGRRGPGGRLHRRRDGGVHRLRRTGPDEFFFMEMNTRLQVEHPVTELA